MAYVHRDYPEFSWSSGRFKMLENCNRRYYFNYYASHNGWLWNADKLQQESYLLKKLTNKYTLSGDIVHEKIKESIDSIIVNKYRELSPDIADEYIKKALEEFNMHVTLSKEYGSKWTTKIKNFKMLQEFYYNESFDGTQKEYITDNIHKCLNNFFSSKTLKELNTNNIEILENDEKELSSFNCSGIKVYAKLDLLYKMNNKYMIVDWKTGKEDEADYLQLLIYAKYVAIKYNVDINDIVCRVEYLKTNTYKEYSFTQEDIEQSNYFILGTVSTMLELLEDAELNKAKPIDNFSKCSDSEKCQNCNFKKLCNE